MKQLSLFTLVFTFIFALAFTFSSCGNSNTNDIPNTGNTNGVTDNTPPHVHEYQTSVTAPTCTDKGYTTHTCACGHSYIANEINALGHDYESVVTMPTETTNGYTTYTCSCGDSYIGDYTNPLSPSSGLKYELTDYENGYIVTGIGNCTDTNLVIPSTHEGLPVVSIGDEAFYYCSNLKNITIPNSIVRISDHAFWGCSSLTSITIPDNVTSIDDYAFDDCSRLTDVYYTGSEDDWAKISFGSSNSPLTNATKHYNYVAEEA